MIKSEFGLFTLLGVKNASNCLLLNHFLQRNAPRVELGRLLNFIFKHELEHQVVANSPAVIVHFDPQNIDFDVGLLGNAVLVEAWSVHLR